MLIFHGYGLTHQDMLPIVGYYLKRGYKVFAFDLFLHGESSWGNLKQAIQLEDWKAILSLFFEKENVMAFSLLSYSLGSKFALTTLYLFPERVDEMNLIAPDSINISPWYRLATSTVVGRFIFRKAALNYKLYHLLIKFLALFKLVDNTTLRFAKSQVQNEAQASKVYYVWVLFRKLYVSFKILKQLLNKHNIQLYLLLGKYDRIVKYKHVEKKLIGIHNLHVDLVELGHTRLIEKFVELRTDGTVEP